MSTQKVTKTETRTETKQETVKIKVGPLMKVVVRGEEHDLSFTDLNTTEDAATISDQSLISAVAKALNISEADLKEHEIARVATGNILISPHAVFGG